MTESQNFTSAYLVACAELHHLYFIASNLTRSAKLLHEQGNNLEHCQSFHLLVSMAFELFLKIIIGCDTCLHHQNDVMMTVNEIRRKIVKELIKSNHNLKELFEKYPDLMKELEIEAVTRVPDGDSQEWFVSEYRFKIKNYNDLLSVKDVEAVRYGSFSKKRDVVMGCGDDGKILNLLSRLQDFVREKRLATIQQMRKIT